MTLREAVQLARELESELSRSVAGEVRFDPYTRVLYSTDASSYQVEPVGVVIPRSRDDVQATLTHAARLGVPVLARGAGTSLAGQAVGAAVVLDFSKHMRRIVEINPDAHWVRAEPGVVCDGLNAALRPHGLMYGPEPASANRATVGGMLANNATGAHSILYGMAADHVLAVDACLADGQAVHLGALEPAGLDAARSASGPIGALYAGLAGLVETHAQAIRDHFPRTWRRASGYSLNYLLPPHGYTATQPPGWEPSQSYPPAAGFNLAKLIAGSEGTLAIATEARLNLVPRPRHTGLLVLHFDSIAAAADATPAILDCQPAAVELIDAFLINLTRSAPGYARLLTFINGHPAALLVVEFFADSEPSLSAQMARLEAHLSVRGVRLAAPSVRAMTAEQQANVWGVRKVGLGLITSMRSRVKPIAFMEDVAVPVAHLGAYVRAVERLFAEHHTESAFYAHASAGCLHIRPVIDLRSPDGLARMEALAAAVLELVVSFGGAMSGEHGDGLSRSAFNGRLFGPELYAAFCAVKRLFDPAGQLNPGKIVEAPGLTDNLRYDPSYAARDVPTHLSFAREGGLAGAVEQCNGAGVCRQSGGTMCPSFQATREEEHSTRGRANALRAALDGRLPPAALTAPRMHAVLDLCLECKACQTECPSGVDMAKVKYEFLAQYQAVHGVPLRSRLFGHIHAVSRMAQPLAPVANALLRARPVRWLNAKVLGIARERRLPPFALMTFREWFARYQQSAPADRQPRTVVLLVDTFTQFNHPEIGQAAVRVLNAAGFTVRLAAHGCCGRPLLSKGLLDGARQAARQTVSILRPLAEAGLPMVGLEPSCTLTLRDEYLDLLPGAPEARKVAGQVQLIEEFLSDLSARGELPLSWRPVQNQRVLVHGHCYQKALTSTRPLLSMLRLPGWQVSEVQSGCCGMAGSFGYEAEHFALSQAIGEDRLFPAVRAAESTARIAASGMSCRHQIEHGTGRSARHPIELLADALA